MVVSKIESALSYTGLGWRVFPCFEVIDGVCACGKPCGNQGGKHPRITGGLNSASADPDQVASWWRQWPHANIGIAVPNDAFVIDVDPRHGGDKTLESLNTGEIRTITQKTGSDGRHFIFTIPDDTPAPRNGSNILPGIDIRAKGGYIIAAPSTHLSGGAYEWLTDPFDNDVMPCPEWAKNIVLEQLRKPEIKTSKGPSALGRTVIEGMRNQTLTALAGTMRRKGMDEPAILAALLSTNVTRCNPPLPEEEVNVIARSVSRYEIANETITAENIAERVLEGEIVAIDLRGREDKSMALTELMVNRDAMESLAYYSIGNPSDFALLENQLVSNGIKVREWKALKTAVKALVNQFSAEPEPEQETSYEDIAGCPVTGMKIPKPYQVTKTATLGTKKKALFGGGESVETFVVANVPILIECRLFEIDTQEHFMRVVWYERKKWHRLVVPREIALNSSKVVDCAKYGFPVSSGNAKEIVKYLQALEDANHSIPTFDCSSHMGWTKAKDAFLWGARLITADEVLDPLDPDNGSISELGQKTVMLKTPTPETAQMAEGFHQHGDWEGWKRFMSVAAEYPYVLVSVYTALAPILISVFEAPNFCVDWSGRTSKGKTTTLRVSASVWGNPESQGGRPSIIHSWKSSRVFIERMMIMLGDLPSYLDDTKACADKTIPPAVVYDAVQGINKGRGSIKGVQGQGSFRTVLHSTGETEILSQSTDGGAAARTFELWGSPFGSDSPETARVVQELNVGAADHYGFLGPMFTQEILKRKHLWPKWKKAYENLRRDFADEGAKQDGVVSRVAANVALIKMVAMLVDGLISDMPWRFDEPGVDQRGHHAVNVLWEYATLKSGNKSDRAKAALEVIIGWIAASQGRFMAPGDSDKFPPPGGWFGKTMGGTYWIIVQEAKKVLKSEGYDSIETIRAWAESGWLQSEPQGKVTRIGVTSCRCIGINPHAIMEESFAPPSHQSEDYFSD